MHLTARVLPLTLVVLTLVLTGCPYQSEVPLDQPGRPLDLRLVGSWQEASTSSPIYTVEAVANEYQIRSQGESETQSFRAHLTLVGTRWYLNLREENDLSRYSLFRLDIDDASFSLHPVTENITETFSDSAALFAFVEKNQDLSFFFERPTRYVRPVSP